MDPILRSCSALAGLLLLPALAGCGGEAPRSPAPARGPARAPALTARDIPVNRTGEILEVAPNPGLGIRVWFARGMRGHQGAMALLYTAKLRQPTRVAIIGAVGEKNPKAVQLARQWRAWRPYDVIIINSKESVTLTGTDGRKRVVRFRGFEGKDYRLEDLQRVLVREYERAYPGETLDLQ